MLQEYAELILERNSQIYVSYLSPDRFELLQDLSNIQEDISTCLTTLKTPEPIEAQDLSDQIESIWIDLDALIKQKSE